MGCYTFFLVFVVMIFLMSFKNYGIEGRQIISREEDLEFEEQLKILNKAPVKTLH
ncbi:hypothetical protein MKW94_019927, partial [Papaver nudicaule]|nr:hypothetical protein [Papaver nudicaule]